MDINVYMEAILDINEYVSKYSTSSCFLKPLSTNLALYLSIVPSFFISFEDLLMAYWFFERKIH
jgi:hypothetical protein